MIYVLLEQEQNVINSVEDEFIQKFKKSSVRRFGNEKVAAASLVEFKTPPLFDSCWLIICGNRMISNLAQLIPDKNVVLIKITKKGDLTKTIESLGSWEYEVIDNYKVESSVVIEWVMKQLGINEKLAKYLYNRVQGNLKGVVEGTRKLALLPKVTQTSIRETVREYNGVSVYSIVKYMLGIEERVQYEQIMQMLYDFRYATNWLTTSILRELKLYCFIYDAMDAGELTLLNYHEFLRNCSDSVVRNLQPYRVKKLIESHAWVSTELVYFLRFRIEALHGNVLPEIVKLIKVGGNNVYSL